MSDNDQLQQIAHHLFCKQTYYLDLYERKNPLKPLCSLILKVVTTFSDNIAY